ncbi:exopolyphosphatase [Shewanella sp. Choline-02u-19]|uniref:Ppx/GppA phosphatase family protein n=1 Tax=unclassified Shewanella TaxID=196818 RepID=UPI000C34AE4F|nr:MULTISPECIES: exopolyphosphatase [unclassified Shewanella]PKH58794.1 exopolyphosphatase [Shewanella sp. Bg11-22]PKI29059.1 exopolyphosphatase [Shewanella sp. Choline-02u-19]
MSAPCYAAITLGSNSFNMMVAKTVSHHPQIIAKYKRKVRLAEGIEADGLLNSSVMTRGIDCLAMFAEMLKKEGVSADNVEVIATATLRKISNADDFCQQALTVLPHPIRIISGIEEADLIYQGMAATTEGRGRRLVIDIGGASTEFIIGDGNKVLLKTSLPMGCVTFNHSFFNQFPFQPSDFDHVRHHVENVLGEYQQQLSRLGWHSVVGASGSVQSVVELLCARGESTAITLDVLYRLKQEILAQNSVSMLDIEGLKPERAPTFAAGIAILLALFELLNIETLQLSGGALREGILHQLAQRCG